MKTLLSLLFLSTLMMFKAQTGKLYQGTINKSVKITLYLEGLNNGTFADPISGTYQYANKKDYLLLNGYRNYNGNIVLTEFSNVNFSGTFFGTMSKNKIGGNWTSADQKKNYKFELTEITPEKNQTKLFHDAMINKGNEFRNY